MCNLSKATPRRGNFVWQDGGQPGGKKSSLLGVHLTGIPRTPSGTTTWTTTTPSSRPGRRKSFTSFPFPAAQGFPCPPQARSARSAAWLQSHFPTLLAFFGSVLVQLQPQLRLLCVLSAPRVRPELLGDVIELEWEELGQGVVGRVFK